MTALLIVPLLGLLGLAILQFLQAYGDYTNAVTLDQAVHVATDASNLVHELQKERGMTAGFVGSEGQRFSSELADQQRLTDKALKAFRDRLSEQDVKAFGKQVVETLGAAMDKIEELGSWRRRVRALGTDAGSAIGEYTQVNGHLLDMVGQMASVSDDPGISRMMVGYVNLLRAKERAGIIRALLTRAFTLGTFVGNENLYTRFVLTEGARDAHAKVFEIQASDAERELYDRLERSQDTLGAAAMRDKALQGLRDDFLGIDPAAWFAAQTQRIDALKTVEDKVSTDLLERGTEIASDGLVAMSVLIVVVLALLAMTAIFGLLLMRNILRGISGIGEELFAASGQTLEASRQVASSGQSLAEGASEQAASLEEIASTMEELAGMTKQNASNSSQVESLADGVNASARKGGDAMDRMEVAIQQIKESSDQTARIIKTIDEIAFQTNLLALNAAVEAARAGDAGKGFAVVAEEVRNLAQRSAEAARSTSELIEASQERADAGVNVTREVQSALKEVNDSVGQVLPLIKQVSNASGEQSRGIEQVNEALSQMDTVTQSNAANAEENSAAGEELSSQAESTNAIVESLMRLIYGAAGDDRLAELSRQRPATPPAIGHAATHLQPGRAKAAGAPDRPAGRAANRSAADGLERGSAAPHTRTTGALNLKEAIQSDRAEAGDPPPPMHDLTDADFQEIR